MHHSPERPDDSLDSLNRMTDKFKSQLFQAKHQFVTSLQKLQSTGTREIAIMEIRKLFDTHREPESLRIFIAVLKTLKPDTNSATKEHEVLVVSLLSQIYKDQLIDPFDKPPSVLKTCYRLVQILHGYFADVSNTVQIACARALLDLTIHSLKNESLESVVQIVFTPLAVILKTGVDKASQATASVCINQLVAYWSRNNPDALTSISREVLAVVLKVNSEYQDLFSAVITLIESKGLEFFEGKVGVFLAKILGVISGTRESLSNYLCKVNVCRIIERVAGLLDAGERAKMGQINLEDCLERATRNRIIQVQMAAQRALKAWRGEAPKGLTSLQEVRNNKIRSKSGEKEGSREKIESQLTFMKQDLDEMVKGGWGASNRAKRFVKRGSGIGGGVKLDSSPSPQPKNGKSHKEHIQELREYIRKGAEENKHIDRYKLAEERKGQEGEFVLEEESGDQGVNLGRRVLDGKDGKQKQNADKGQKYGKMVGDMPSEEIKDLLNHADSLMEEGAEMDITYNSREREKLGIVLKDASKKVAKEKEDARSWFHKQEASARSNSHGKFNEKALSQKSAPVMGQPEENKKIGKKEVSQKREPQQKKKEGAFQLLSQEEIGELVNECDLSQVSDNLDGILNQSDLLEQSKESQMDSAILQRSQTRPETALLKGIIQDSKSNRQSRVSAFNKFLKSPIEVPLMNSLNFTESNPSKVQRIQYPPKLIQSPPKLIQSPPKLIQSPPKLIQSPPKLMQPPSAHKEIIQNPSLPSGQKEFTLNLTTEKYTTVKPPNNQEEEEIEEDIFMSEYEESVPKRDFKRKSPQARQLQIPPFIEAPQPEVEKKTFARKVEERPEEHSRVYQAIIKNPPKLVAFNNGETQSERRQSAVQKVQEVEGVSVVWLRVLACLQRGETNEAFELVLQLQDPIYLLRLLVLTECPMRDLTVANAVSVWRNFLQIYKHRLMDVLYLQLLGQAHELRVLKGCLSAGELQEALIELFEISGNSKGKLSFSAATLYNGIEESLRPAE